jgi:hypothetical protein
MNLYAASRVSLQRPFIHPMERHHFPRISEEPRSTVISEALRFQGLSTYCYVSGDGTESGDPVSARPHASRIQVGDTEALPERSAQYSESDKSKATAALIDR